jgi:hypothetical protein
MKHPIITATLLLSAASAQAQTVVKLLITPLNVGASAERFFNARTSLQFDAIQGNNLIYWINETNQTNHTQTECALQTRRYTKPLALVDGYGALFVGALVSTNFSRIDTKNLNGAKYATRNYQQIGYGLVVGCNLALGKERKWLIETNMRIGKRQAAINMQSYRHLPYDALIESIYQSDVIYNQNDRLELALCRKF